MNVPAIPAHAAPIRDAAGNVTNKGDVPLWSGTGAPPPIGSHVVCDDRKGTRVIVTGYEVQAGWLMVRGYRADDRSVSGNLAGAEILPRYRVEFPDYPAADMPALPADWADESWHNETCPHFRTAAGLSVFVDYADPAAREFPEIQRFSVSRLDGDAVWDLFTSDDWAEIVAYVAAYEGQELPESTYEAFREGRASRAQYVTIKAENDAAALPCPDLARHLATVLAPNG